MTSEIRKPGSTDQPDAHVQGLTSLVGEPNLPEVSGTSFPLLTTVLAGFAVTIAVQLIIRPDASESLPFRVTLSIIIFLTSTLVFISSIVFAVNAQSHNYLPFISDDGSSSRMHGVSNRDQWINWLHRGWESFHSASIITFYSGILLLLAGVNIIVWEFVSGSIALIVLSLIIANIALNVLVGLRIDRRKRRDIPDSCRQNRVATEPRETKEQTATTG
jgi:hypothetical protein